VIARLLGLVFNRYVLFAVLFAGLALVVWIAGPLVAFAERRPLETEAARGWTIGAIALAFLLLVGWQAWRARRGNATVVKQLMAAPEGQPKETESADLQAVRQRFERSLLTLRRARFGPDGGGLLKGWSAKVGGRYLYELPWYLIIGAPGSGKTTALQHSGLRFPLAEAGGAADAIRGVGGTRNCDWWFTDRAVLIDTAGRFTTQDSDRETDKGTWGGFLGLLKRTRPRQPLNGVLVTVSVPDLLAKGLGERRQYALTVRQRLQELHDGLKVRLPIYLLVTKADLLAGFTDAFATLDKDQRATPWGVTFPLGTGVQRDLERFGPEFDALVRRLDDGLIDRLRAERDPQRRARIYGFAGQFASVRAPLAEFLETTFAASPYEAETLLRGVYFVSGTQEGTPIDRVLGSIARAYRLERAVLAPNQASGKSFFLNRLLQEVVFAESGVAGTDLGWERKRKGLAIAAYVAIALVGVGATVAWTTSYLHNRAYVADVAQRTATVRELVKATPNRASPDAVPVLPALQATRSLAGVDEDPPWTLGFGLYQGPKLDSAARASYERMLADALLPRLALRVEEQLRQSGNPTDTQYEALKAYLMLHDPQRFDAEALKGYVEADWDRHYGRGLDPDRRAELSRHLDALLARGAAVSPLVEDKALVDFHRQRLATVTLPQRIYNRMRQQGLGKEFPEFTVLKAGGSNAALVFTRPSGAPLSRGVPGLFSYDGYHRGFQREVARVAGQLADEQGWVLGVRSELPRDPAALVRGNESLLDDVRRLYLNEYAQAWEAFVADVRLLPMASLSQSIQMSRLLSAADSPLPPLLRGMSRETTLLGTGGRTSIEKASDTATGLIRGARDALAGAVSPRPQPSGPAIESIVDDRFTGLRRLVTAPEGGGGKAPLDETVALIGEVNLLLATVDNAIKSGAAPAPSPLPVKVKAEAARLPEPVRSMMDTLSDSSARVSQTMVRQNLGNEVRSQVGEFCQQAVAGRYPFDRNAAREVTPADFASLFGPGGRFDTLFQQKLAPYVDTSSRPWKFRPVDGTPLGSDIGTLAQFQRAQAIRETFFAGGAAAALRLQFKPIDMDATLKQVNIDVDGQNVRYDHGPQVPVTVAWPGPRGSTQVRVSVDPQTVGNTFGAVYEGPWALFRLFDRVQVEPTNAAEKVRATFDIGGRKATFEVVAASVRNPFNLRELKEFSCPMGL
jgi:type VI secretion system protein ImpL